MLFAGIFGIDSFNIEAKSSAGLTVQSVPTDTVILLDTSSSMAANCDQDLANPGCAIKEAKDASHSLVDVLLGGLNTASQVGYGAYTFCYGPEYGNAKCIMPPNLLAPAQNQAAVHAAITGTPALQDETTRPAGGTNVCLALDKAVAWLNSSSAQVKNVVVLTDGDNNFFYNASTVYPPAQCRASQDANQNCGTEPSLVGEREMDVKTLQRADALKALGTQVYVVAFKVCGTRDDPDCAAIGNADPDNVADRRLLKCIASSPSHYVEITNASEIPDAFREIAAAIVSRGLLE
jgi:hypothetical protein